MKYEIRWIEENEIEIQAETKEEAIDKLISNEQGRTLTIDGETANTNITWFSGE